MSETVSLMIYFGMFCALFGYVLGCFVMLQTDDKASDAP